MNATFKSLLALVSLIGAFYVSISLRFGDPGWHVEFSAQPASARSEEKSDYDLKSLPILNRAVIHIKENYVDPSRINERKMIGAAMEEVQRTVAELLVDVQKDEKGVPSKVVVRVDVAEKTFDLTDVKTLWQMSFKFKDIFEFIEHNLKHHRKLRDIEYAAINGMLSTLDPHSVLLKPENYREMKLSTRGKFGGLGIVISIREGHLTVINPMEGTPAAKAGIKIGDRIVQIGLDSTVNMALNDAVDMLRGDPNTKVDIWIIRDGWKKPRKYTLTRADIKVKSVSSQLLVDSVGLVRIRNFQNTTFEELQQALEALQRQNKGPFAGLILDLRGNPGGLLDQAIKVADLFIESGPLVTTVGYGDRVREPKMATHNGTEPSYPLVVLTDSSSASASEIVAGALKNHHRALLIGQRTFGKGSVQVIYDNKDDSALKLTIAQYLTPGDISIQSVGIVPDLETQPVVLTEDETDFYRSEEAANDWGEKGLPEHLEHETAKVNAQKSIFKIKYLQDEALAARVRENPNDLIADFEIELARDILVGLKSSARDELLKRASLVLSTRLATEQDRIAQALAGRGVDWSELADVSPGKPKAEVVLTTDKGGNQVTAGDTITLEATVKNVGDAPFVRLRALTDSENDYLDGLELLFGNLQPGESRTWKVPIEVPMSALSRRDVLKLQFRQEATEVPEDAILKLEIKQLPRPRFALTYRLDDTALGNGDGLLQRGEEAELVVHIENAGEGDAKALLATLRNDDLDEQREVFVKRGRIEESEGLAVGAHADVRFSFKIKDGTTAATMPVHLTAQDSELRELTDEKLLLKVHPAQAKLQPLAVKLEPKIGTEVLLRGLPSEEAAPVASAPGSAVADALVDGWYRVRTEAFIAWVPETEVKRAGEASGKTKVNPVVPQGPPRITLSDRSLDPETKAESLTLSGEVQSTRLIQDLLIYVNNRKVFFKSNADARSADAVRFSARVPLEQGVNRITVVARQDEDAAARRTVIINRTP